MVASTTIFLSTSPTTSTAAASLSNSSLTTQATRAPDAGSDSLPTTASSAAVQAASVSPTISLASQAPQPAGTPDSGTTLPQDSDPTPNIPVVSPPTVPKSPAKMSSASDTPPPKTTVPPPPPKDAQVPSSSPAPSSAPPASVPKPAPKPSSAPPKSSAPPGTTPPKPSSTDHGVEGSKPLILDSAAPSQSLRVPVPSPIATEVDSRIQTFTPSSVISFTVTQDGHTVVTAPSEFTTTLPYVVGGTTTLMPAIIQNPIPSSGALSNDNTLVSHSFLSNKAMSAGVFAAVGIVVVATVASVMICTRRRKRARQRAYTEAVYTNAMAQRRSFFDPTLPMFEEIPRPPPVPPRRRPVPQYRMESGGSTSLPLTLGTSVHIPNEFGAPVPHNSPHSPSEVMRSPFQDPSPVSGFSELPLLNRPLRSNSSSEGHENSPKDTSRPPSPAPSTPSLYPETLPAVDDSFVFGPTPRPPEITYSHNPFNPSPLSREA